MLNYQRVSSAFKTFLDVSIKNLELLVDLVAPCGSYRRCLRRFLLREDCCTLWDGGNHQPESKRTNMNIMNKLHYKDV